MLKPQDIVILLKIFSTITLAKKAANAVLSQNRLATYLCISVSEVNAGIKRLLLSGLLAPILKKDSGLQILALSEGSQRKGTIEEIKQNKMTFRAVKSSCEECLISGVKYFFPVQLGTYTRGIATSYAAPIFGNHIIVGDDPIPVWPYEGGDKRGLALQPLYPSVPYSLAQYPDELFYELLVLIDAIRSGRTRERAIAVKLLKEKINNE